MHSQQTLPGRCGGVRCEDIRWLYHMYNLLQSAQWCGWASSSQHLPGSSSSAGGSASPHTTASPSRADQTPCAAKEEGQITLSSSSEDEAANVDIDEASDTGIPSTLWLNHQLAADLSPQRKQRALVACRGRATGPHCPTLECVCSERC